MGSFVEFGAGHQQIEISWPAHRWHTKRQAHQVMQRARKNSGVNSAFFKLGGNFYKLRMFCRPQLGSWCKIYHTVLL
jgi:hypothetical protein